MNVSSISIAISSDSYLHCTQIMHRREAVGHSRNRFLLTVELSAHVALLPLQITEALIAAMAFILQVNLLNYCTQIYCYDADASVDKL
jgi:hypothetical protein